MSIAVIHPFGVEIVRRGVRWTVSSIDGGLSVWADEATSGPITLGPDSPPVSLDWKAPLAFFAGDKWIGVKRSD